MLTLIVLALGVFFTSIGVAGWRAVVYPTTGAEASNSPLPLALKQVVGGQGALYHMLVTVGLLGLVASFHGIVLAAGRAALELGRSGYAPRFLGRVNPRTGTPVAALVTNAIVGIVAILSSRTDDLIVLSTLGAITLYGLSMAALFRLRRTEPDLPRPFRAVGYPLFPAVALALSAISLVAMAWNNRTVTAIYAGIMAASAIIWRIARGRQAVPSSISRT
jgi:ethanolamine permease